MLLEDSRPSCQPRFIEVTAFAGVQFLASVVALAIAYGVERRTPELKNIFGAYGFFLGSICSARRVFEFAKQKGAFCALKDSSAELIKSSWSLIFGSTLTGIAYLCINSPAEKTHPHNAIWSTFLAVLAGSICATLCVATLPKAPLTPFRNSADDSGSSEYSEYSADTTLSPPTHLPHDASTSGTSERHLPGQPTLIPGLV
jgi:hypothetical protein